MSLSVNIGRPFLNDKTLDEQARSIIRKYGTDAHVYLPGASGVRVSALNTNNYTLSDGSTGYSAIDGTAGLVLDAAGSVGAELVTNGTFDSDLTGWTNNSGAQSWSAGALRRTPGGFASGSYQEFATVAGQTYLLTGTASPVSGTGAQQVIAYQGGGFTTQLGATSASVSGPFQFFFVATASTTRIYLYSDGTKVVDYDAISVKQVTGIHATQATTANKPAERRGLYNLLTYSQDFTNAAWTTLNWTNAASDIADPLGGTAGRKLSATATPNTLTRGDQVATSTVHTFAVVFKLGTYVNPAFLIRNATTSTNLTATGSYVGNGSGSDAYGTWEFSDFGSNGWKICRITCTSGITVGNSLLLYFGATGGVTNGTYFYVYAGLFMSGAASVAQILSEGGIPLTTSAAASNSGAGRYSWQFDGSNDSLALGSVPFQMSDDHCVIAGAVPNTATTDCDVFGQRSTAATNPLCPLLRFGADGKVKALWRDDAGTLDSAVMVAPYAVGSAHIVSARKVGNSKTVRMNGVSGSTSNLSLGTTTVNTSTIGAGLTTGLLGMFNGSTGPVIVIKGTISDADLLILERWVASQTPNGPVF